VPRFYFHVRRRTRQSATVYRPRGVMELADETGGSTRMRRDEVERSPQATPSQGITTGVGYIIVDDEMCTSSVV
jgi:hypothetical protein